MYTLQLVKLTEVKLQKKKCGGVYFLLYSIAYGMLILQRLSPPELLFNVFRLRKGLTGPSSVL